MLAALTDAGTGLTYRTYTQYDAAGRAALNAGPATVTGLDEAAADLVNFQAGNALYLADAAGQPRRQPAGRRASTSRRP